VLWVVASAPAGADAGPPVARSAANPAGIDWVTVGGFQIARTETTVGQFRRFVQATGTVTAAEQRGGGEVFDRSWVQMPGWVWSTPFGNDRAAADGEPAVHIGWHEAQAFCRWAGGRLPTDAEWTGAAYTEQRDEPPPPFVHGRTYPYPSGPSRAGQQCLSDCGPQANQRAIRHGARLSRGFGHALAGSTPVGVNGLQEMAGNVTEWVDDPPDAAPQAVRLTRGGSWWTGAAQMRSGHRQTYPAETAAVYIGWRCARD
jgi:formylglycine-generating enzyme